MQKENILISSCLYGEYVRYDGSNNKIDKNILDKLKIKYNLVYFCPEVAGGLPTPRVPCEIVSLTPIKIIDRNGKEQTSSFLKGAEKTLELCTQNNITKAILKANSPSCSSSFIYDGTFEGIRVKGTGATTQLLKDNNIEVFDEYEIEKLL